MCIVCQKPSSEEIALLNCLELIDCPDVTEVPATFTAVKLLYVKDCPNFERIPRELDCIIQLVLINCPKVRSLPVTLTILETLICRNETALMSIPKEYQRLEKLELMNCAQLFELPTLQALTLLTCLGLPLLRSLPSFPRLETLNLGSCPLIEYVPAQPVLKTLNCNRLATLLAIDGESTALKRVKFINCALLEDISNLPTGVVEVIGLQLPALINAPHGPHVSLTVCPLMEV